MLSQGEHDWCSSESSTAKPACIRYQSLVLGKKIDPTFAGSIFFGTKSESDLATVVKLEFVRVWTKCDWLDFVNTLVVNPGLD